MSNGTRPSAWLRVVLLVSCTGGQSGDEGASGPPGDAGHGDAAVPPTMGGPGEQPPGALTCKSDAECRSYVETYLDERVAHPRAGGRELEIAQCVAGCGKEAVCACMYRYADRTFLDALELHALGAAERCDVSSRARYCLAEPSAFQGCSLDDPESCDAACLELRDALEEDDRGREVSVPAARCAQGRCLSVWEVEGHCLVGEPIPGAPWDPSGSSEVACADSYDAILDDLAASLGPAPPAPPSGSDAPPAMMSGGAHDAGAAVEGTPRAASSDEPIEANWNTMTDEHGAVWATGQICGAAVGPLCVDGPCPAAEKGDAGD
jgi:hypothetical protein